jgi:hypothetical protein
MWELPPELRRDLAHIRRMTALQRLTPTREWPLTFIPEHDQFLIIREWPNGEITAYAMTRQPLDDR